jgi:hypothetical protein
MAIEEKETKEMENYEEGEGEGQGRPPRNQENKKMLVEEQQQQQQQQITILSQTPESQHSTPSPSITPITPAEELASCVPSSSSSALKTNNNSKTRKSKGKEKDGVPEHVQLISDLPQANLQVLIFPIIIVS